LKRRIDGGAVFKLEDNTTNNFTFFSPSGNYSDNVRIKGIRFKHNWRNQPEILTYLTSDASAGDTTVDVEDASKFEGVVHIVIRDSDNVERYKEIDSVDTTNNTITFSSSLNNSYETDKGTPGLVRYPTSRGVDNDCFYKIVLVEGCYFENPKLQAVMLGYDDGTDGSDRKTKGVKVIKDNVVEDHVDGGALRVARSQYSIIADNEIIGSHFSDKNNTFWEECLSSENSEQAVVKNNLIYDFDGRAIRSPRIYNTGLIEGNIIRNDLYNFAPFEDTSAWSPLQGDESLSAVDSTIPRNIVADTDNNQIEVAGGTSDNPGIVQTDIGEDWSDYNHAHVWVKSSEGSDWIWLHIEDSGGNYKEYKEMIPESNTWTQIPYNLDNPQNSSGILDWTDIQKVELYVETSTDNITWDANNLAFGRSTNWSITVYDSHNVTVANNVIYGAGSKDGSIYHDTGSDVSITGNNILMSLTGIGSTGSGISATGNTLYSVVTGIKGNGTADGNTLRYIGYPDYSINMDNIIGNYLYHAGEIEVTSNSIIVGNKQEKSRWHGISGGTVDNAVIAFNEMIGIGDNYCISTSGGSDCVVIGNRVDNWQSGVYVQGLDHTILGNRITNCYYGVRGIDSTTLAMNNPGAPGSNGSGASGSVIVPAGSTATVSTGMDANTKPTVKYDLASDPGSDVKIQYRLMWDTSVPEWKVEFEETTANADANVEYVVEQR